MLSKQAFTKHFSQISTSTVDNVVGNRHLTGWKASTGAGFNKMPNLQAEKLVNAINDLDIVKLCRMVNFQVAGKYF
jgi:hypothetical protein